MEAHDIIVHEIPNVNEAEQRLREELDEFEHLFGPIQYVKMFRNRRFFSTSYAFVRYRNTSIHSQIVEYLNWIGIPNTQIWFEMNPIPTDQHFIEDVSTQIDEVEHLRSDLNQQIRQQQQYQEELEELRLELEEKKDHNKSLKEQLVEATRTIITLEAKLVENQDLINQLVNQSFSLEAAQTNASNDSSIQSISSAQLTNRASFIPLDQLPNPPLTKCHRFTRGRCPKCDKKFGNCNSIVEMQCGHLACEECMYRYVRRQLRSCPICRAQLGYSLYRRISE